VILFGSRAAGNALPQSDIDVLLTEEELEGFPTDLAWEHGGMCDVYVRTEEGRLYTAFDPGRTDTHIRHPDDLGVWEHTDLGEIEEMNQEALEYIVSQNSPERFPYRTSIPIKNAVVKHIAKASTGESVMIIKYADLDYDRAKDGIIELVEVLGVFGLVHALQRLGYEIETYSTREITLRIKV
jgi:hypothetical protein